MTDAAQDATDDQTDTDEQTDDSSVSLIIRMDFTVTDRAALIGSAVLALQEEHPELSDSEAARAIGGQIEDSLFTLINTVGMDALLDTDGLEVRATAAEVAFGLDEIEMEPDESV